MARRLANNNAVQEQAPFLIALQPRVQSACLCNASWSCFKHCSTERVGNTEYVLAFIFGDRTPSHQHSRNQSASSFFMGLKNFVSKKMDGMSGKMQIILFGLRYVLYSSLHTVVVLACLLAMCSVLTVLLNSKSKTFGHPWF